jgi:hypothetical protein
MKNYEDFSVDSDTGAAFAGTADYVKALREEKQKRVIPIIDAGLQNNDNSEYISDANTANCLIKQFGSEAAVQ